MTRIAIPPLRNSGWRTISVSEGGFGLNAAAMRRRLEFRDFGVFEIRERAARRAQNPKTLEQVDVPARRTVKFKTGRLMKNKVEGGTD